MTVLMILISTFVAILAVASVVEQNDQHRIEKSDAYGASYYRLN